VGLREIWGSTYDIRFPITLPHWGEADGEFDLPCYDAYANFARAGGRSIFEALVPLGYMAFWEIEVSPRSFDGFCAVLPGYDDSLLKRNPQLAARVDPQSGDTFVRQFERALSNAPQHVIVYGWNEYFETSEIEPTKENGTLYLELAREMIGKVRSPA